MCVRERSGWLCERCGSMPDRQGLHCAHVMSRGHWSVRFDPANALALCYGCHRITEQKRELEFIPLVKKIFGEVEWDRVFSDAQKLTGRQIRKQVPAIARHYRAEHGRMIRYRDCGHTGRLEFEPWR
jgi:hypothetical protein